MPGNRAPVEAQLPSHRTPCQRREAKPSQYTSRRVDALTCSHTHSPQRAWKTHGQLHLHINLQVSHADSSISIQCSLGPSQNLSSAGVKCTTAEELKRLTTRCETFGSGRGRGEAASLQSFPVHMHSLPPFSLGILRYGMCRLARNAKDAQDDLC